MFQICRSFMIHKLILMATVIKRCIRSLHKIISVTSFKSKYMMNLIMLIFEILEWMSRMYWLRSRLNSVYWILFVNVII